MRLISKENDQMVQKGLADFRYRPRVEWLGDIDPIDFSTEGTGDPVNLDMGFRFLVHSKRPFFGQPSSSHNPSDSKFLVDVQEIPPFTRSPCLLLSRSALHHLIVVPTIDRSPSSKRR